MACITEVLFALARIAPAVTVSPFFTHTDSMATEAGSSNDTASCSASDPADCRKLVKSFSSTVPVRIWTFATAPLSASSSSFTGNRITTSTRAPRSSIKAGQRATRRRETVSPCCSSCRRIFLLRNTSRRMHKAMPKMAAIRIYSP